MSTEVKSKDWCPTCLMQNKVQNALQNRAGQFYSSCAAGHQFPDTEELNMMRAQAKAKFPAFYATTAPKVDPNALAGQDIVINAEVKQAMEGIVGQQITSGSDIKGMLYGYLRDNEDKEKEIRSLRATIATMNKRSPLPGNASAGSAQLAVGQFVVTAPEWTLEAINGYAEHENKTVEEWVAENITAWFENYCGAAVSP